MSAYLLAMATESEPFVFTTARGKSHVLMIETPERPGGDVIAHATDGKMRGACARPVPVVGGEPGRTGTMCAGCARFLRSSALDRRIAESLAAWQECDVPQVEIRPEVKRAAKRAVTKADRRKARDAERARLARQEDKRAWGQVAQIADAERERRAAAVAEHVAEHGTSPEVKAVQRAKAGRSNRPNAEAEAKAVAKITDGKCAVEYTDPDTGEVKIQTVHGRLNAGVAEILAGMLGTETVPAGKQAALVPFPVKDADPDITGLCPVCRNEIRVTNSGGVGTHRPGGVTPDGPQLSGRSVPAVDLDGGDTADASKRRAAEAYTVETVTTADGETAERVTPVVERAKKAGAAAGARDHGRSDGVAMLPLGETGYAGVKFDDESRVGVLSIVGGRYGYLTGPEYAEIKNNPTLKRRYWKTVKANERRAAAAREMAKDREIRMGRAIPREERKERRAAASVGKSEAGHVLSHYGRKRSGATAEESRKAAGLE